MSVSVLVKRPAPVILRSAEATMPSMLTAESRIVRNSRISSRDGVTLTVAPESTMAYGIEVSTLGLLRLSASILAMILFFLLLCQLRM